MSDPAQEPSEPERGRPQEASLEDLVAALGRPRTRGDAPEEEEDEDEVTADGAEAKETEPDPFAEYSNLDLATSLPIDPDDDLSKVEGEASPRLMSIIESLLFAADKPMTVKSIRRLLKEPTKRQIQLSIKQLIFDTQHRGVVLGQVAGGFRLRTHPDNAPFVQKMMAGKPVRLSRSQLESLAVVAYRQPVTKAELDHIRGVDCGAVLRVLLERDLAKIVGRKEEAGRPHLYGTTVAFLEFFNLKGLRDLPDLHEFKELSEESEATLRHTVQSGSLSDEQEAMGQSRIEFPVAEGGQGAEDTAAAEPGAATEGPLDAESQEVSVPGTALDAEPGATASDLAVDAETQDAANKPDGAPSDRDAGAESPEPLEIGALGEVDQAEPVADPIPDPEHEAHESTSESAPNADAELSASEAAGTDSRSSDPSEGSAEQPSDPTASEPDAADAAPADDVPKDDVPKDEP